MSTIKVSGLADLVELLLTAAMSDQVLAEPDRYLRIVAGALALVQQHTIDDKGSLPVLHQPPTMAPSSFPAVHRYTAFSTYLTPPDSGGVVWTSRVRRKLVVIPSPRPGRAVHGV